MFKRLILLAISFAIFSTQTYASSQSGLKAAYDEFAYAMEVEGASLNTESREAAARSFAEQVAILQSQGLSNTELIQFVQSQIQDKTLAAELTATYKLLETEKLSSEEVRDILKNMSSHIYAQGASWNGDVQMYLFVGGFLAVMIAVAILVPADKCTNEAYARGNPDACADSWYARAHFGL